MLMFDRFMYTILKIFRPIKPIPVHNSNLSYLKSWTSTICYHCLSAIGTVFWQAIINCTEPNLHPK